MEVILKLFFSIFSYVALAVLGALAFGAPTEKHKNEKVEKIKQAVIFYSVFFIVLYFIWIY